MTTLDIVSNMFDCKSQEFAQIFTHNQLLIFCKKKQNMKLSLHWDKNYFYQIRFLDC